jgi:hypothetical protein
MNVVFSVVLQLRRHDMENCGDIAYASHAVVLAKRVTPAELRTVESRDKTSGQEIGTKLRNRELRDKRRDIATGQDFGTAAVALFRSFVPPSCPEVLSRFSVPKLCPEVLCSEVLCSVV